MKIMQIFNSLWNNIKICNDILVKLFIIFYILEFKIIFIISIKILNFDFFVILLYKF